MIRKLVIPSVIILFTIPFYFYHLGYNFKGYDEGVQLYATWRISRGELPYKDFFFVYIPTIHFLIAILYRIFGISIILPRIVTVICVYLTAILLYKISSRIKRNPIIPSLVFLAYLINFYTLNFGRQFRLLHYMIFTGFLGLFLTERGLCSKNNKYIFISGLILGISNLIKLQGVAFYLGCVLIFLFKKEIKSLSYLTLGFFLSSIIPIMFLLKNYPSAWEMVFQFHRNQPSRYLFPTVKEFFLTNIYLIILSLPFFLKFRFNKQTFDLMLCFLFILFAIFPFLLGKIIWIQYFYPLIPIMVIFLSYCFYPLRSKSINVFLALVFLIYLFSEIKKDMRYLNLWKEFDYTTLKLTGLIRANTQEGDYILSEIFHLNLLASRKCPPELTDISHTRIISGDLDVQELVDSLEEYKVKMIIFDTNPFRLQLLKNYQKFQRYLNKHFKFLGYIRRKYDILQVYLRK